MSRAIGLKLLRGLPVAAAAVAVTMMTATAASAATTVSQASASAIQVAALRTPLIPTSTAVNDGSTPTVTSTLQGAIPLLPGETLANTGVYVQTATATSSATSAACAGIVGAGGTLTLGQDGNCTATTAGPAIINLPSFSVAGTGYTFQLKASSLYSYCTAGPSAGTTGFSAGSTLANVSMVAQTVVFGIRGPAVTIPINADGSFSIPPPFASVLSLATNQVNATGPQTSATALHIGLGPNSSVASIDIGKTLCGANATTVDVPALPITPGAVGTGAGTLAVIGGAAFAVRKHRSKATHTA